MTFHQMLLRSSSAPAAQSLFSDWPNRDLDTSISNNNSLTNAQEHCITKISFGHGLQHLSSFSCNSSPNCPSNSWLPELSPKGRIVGRKTFRRAQSDSNLEGLALPASFDLEEFYSSRTLMSESLGDHQKSMLHTEPSFSIYSTDEKFEEEAKNEDLIKEKLVENEGKLERSVTIGESIEAQFSFGTNAMRIINEDDNGDEEVDEEEEEKERASNQFKDPKIEIQSESMSRPIYLVTGAGRIEAEIGGDGIEFGPSNSDHNGDLDKYYNKMVREDPSNPLVLRNYAQYLESIRDFSGAEKYYFRATLADHKDGEILSKYAQLVWELHGDQDRATNYFERATQAAPEDSNVLAAYASFLWKIDENEEKARLSNTQVDENSALVDLVATDFKERRPSSPPLHLAMGLRIDIAGFGGGNNAVDCISTHSDERTTVEEYCRRMVEENPCNPLFLRNYAQFLHQSKGDLQGAEEYYSRAILDDPGDGQMLSLYANIVWQLHHDKDRAVAYFEQAIQATPEDSNVLAAYAKFLWETGAEDDIEEAQNGMPVARGAATATNT